MAASKNNSRINFSEFPSHLSAALAGSTQKQVNFGLDDAAALASIDFPIEEKSNFILLNKVAI